MSLLSIRSSELNVDCCVWEVLLLPDAGQIKKRQDIRELHKYRWEAKRSLFCKSLLNSIPLPVPLNCLGGLWRNSCMVSPKVLIIQVRSLCAVSDENEPVISELPYWFEHVLFSIHFLPLWTHIRHVLSPLINPHQSPEKFTFLQGMNVPFVAAYHFT